MRYLQRLEEQDVERLAPVAQWAFGIEDAGRARRWFQRGGVSNLRGIDAGDGLVGGLMLVPMGQWFGGRSVPMVGIAGVAVDPTVRGRGLARAMLTATLGELREGGTPLTTLYPATYRVYESVGYGVAGTRARIRVPAAMLASRERTAEVRALVPADEEAVQALYRQRARLSPGYLDRGPYIWFRVRNPAEKPARGYGVEVGGQLAGYTFVRQSRVDPDREEYDLTLTDLVATRPEAARALLGFLGDHRSMAEKVIWYGDLADPAVALWPDCHGVVTIDEQWMTRIVDLPAALEARGYAPGLRGEVHLEVDDDLLPDNAGPWVLRVSDGRGAVERGGRGELAIDVRGLATLYTGLRGAEQLRIAGNADGPEAAMAAATALFTGPTPAMVDGF